MDDFPDLATGPEVFETSDAEPDEPLAAQPAPPSSAVQFDALDPAAARAAFENHTIVDALDIPDFSGALNPALGSSGYTVRPWTETNGQRLARIARELREIRAEDTRQEQEIAQLSGEIGAHVAARGKTGQYHRRLDELVSRIQVQAAEGTDAAAGGPAAAAGKRSGADAVLGIEKRISRIEQALGVDELRHGHSLHNHVRDLGRKVGALVSPEHDMAALTAEMGRLSKELEQLTATRRLAQLAVGGAAAKPKPPFEAKVDALYKRIDATDRARAVLPATMERLRGLHQIHADLAASVCSIGELDSTIDSLRRDMAQWNQSLDRVGSAVDEQSRKFEENKALSEKKVADLESRLQNLA